MTTRVSNTALPRMVRWSGQRMMLTLLLGTAAWVVVAVGAMAVGSTGVHWPSAREFQFRLDPVLTASLVGAALAAAGVACQAVLRNALADPYLLGASSGAALGGYVWRLPMVSGLLGAAGTFGVEAGQESFAFIGALAAVALVLMLSRIRGAGRLDPLTLLLVGVIINAMNGSLLLLIDAMHRAVPGTGGALGLLVGGIRMVSGSQMGVAAICIGVGWLVVFYIAGPLTAATLGEAEAQGLGVRIHRLRWTALGAASLMTAAAVALSGPIVFVGLICPHAARLIVGTDQRRLLPVATAAGAILLVVADALSRWLAQSWLNGSELQVGILTGLLGGPFFLTLLCRRKTNL